jgi:Transposase IS66 family
MLIYKLVYHLPLHRQHQRGAAGAKRYCYARTDCYGTTGLNSLKSGDCDGYSAYASYAEKTGLTHAQCWAHIRRNFFEVRASEPKQANQALDLIGKL